MELYEELQEVNERRRSRIEAYNIYIEQTAKEQMSEIVLQLIEIRKKQGKTQQDIADATGMAAPNIARIEGCRRVASMQALIKYAKAVGMKVQVGLMPES